MIEKAKMLRPLLLAGDEDFYFFAATICHAANAVISVIAPRMEQPILKMERGEDDDSSLEERRKNG